MNPITTLLEKFILLNNLFTSQHTHVKQTTAHSSMCEIQVLKLPYIKKSLNHA